MTNLNKDFQETITARKAATDKRLDELHQRITDLNTYFEEQKAAILKYVDDRGEELTKLLNKFKVSLLKYPERLNYSSTFSQTGRIRRRS